MIYKKPFLVIALVFFVLAFHQNLLAAEDKYPVDAIPDSLKKSANAVIRFEEIIFDLKSIEKAELRISYAITILNENALVKSYFAKPYDQFSKIRDIKGAVYDEHGKLVKKIKQDEILDISANSGGSLFVDHRTKLIDPEYLKYPFTVEYSCKIEYDGLLNYPAWQIYNDYNVSVEQTRFSIRRPGHLEIRMLVRDIEQEPKEQVLDGDHMLTWEVRNKVAIKKEPLSDELSKLSPAIILAPDDFLIDGYKGNSETWKNFGSWIYTLNEGKRTLPEESKQKISALIQNAGSDYEKAEILYQYLQDNTRYVSVQIGIGGWQPIEAEEVDRLSYGDCKALTNYMRALLDIAGIESYYTLVKAGRNASEITSDFPSNQFNHAILCAAIDNDTIWMECTSQRLPFGYIGSFTDDRDVVLINEEGGQIVHTKAYTEDENQRICKASITMDDQGDGIGLISTEHKGVFYDEKLPALLSDLHDQKRLIRESLHIPNFVMDDYSLDGNRKAIPSIYENIHVTIDGCGTRFGNRMAINLNMINKIGKIPSKNEDRRSDIIVRRSIVEIDSVVYKIPEGMAVEKASGNREIKSEFGELHTTVSIDGSEVHYARRLKLNKGTYSSETYGEFYEFYKAVKKADEDRVILTRSNLITNQ